MSHTSRYLAPVLLLVFSAACPPAPDGRTENPEAARLAIEQHEREVSQAMVAADTARLGALWAPEYLSTSAVGHTSTRAEALMAYGSGLVRVDSAVVRELDVRVYGNTAVALGFLEWAGSAAARPFGGTVRFQHVWVRADTAWRLVASQLTAQPPPRSPEARES